MLRYAFVALLLASPCAIAAPSPSRTIAGLTLGDPPPFPECATEKMKPSGGRKDLLRYSYHPLEQVCWERAGFLNTRLGQPPGPEPEEVKAYVSTELPKGLSRYVEIVLVDGRVEEIRISTTGSASQRDVLAALTEKYGKPTYAALTPVQNLMGAQFESQDARWEFDDMQVAFIGLVKIDKGTIRVRSAARAAQNHAPQPKL